jgi:hypothetical protein
MKYKLFLGLLFLTASLCAGAQTPQVKTAAPAKGPADSLPATKSETADEQKSKPRMAGDSKQSPAQTAPPKYKRPDAKTRFNNYLKSMFGPMALGKHVASAGFSTWRNSPEEWGEKWDGFGRRFASNVGKSVIGTTTVYVLDEAFKLDSKFYRSQNKKFGARLKNALLSPVTARNEQGKKVFGFPRIAGSYVSSIVSRQAWYPSRYDYKDGLKSGTISLGTNAVYNLIREFVLK